MVLGTNLLDVAITVLAENAKATCLGRLSNHSKKTKENRFCKNMAKQLPVLFM